MTIHPLVKLNTQPLDLWRSLSPGESLPQTFRETIDRVETYILDEFDREIIQQQLYYHNREHINHVRRRSTIIFEAIIPYCQVSSDDAERMRLLLDLCAIAHDAVQVFIPQFKPNTSRKREAGVSEALTIKKLVNYIKDLNRQLAAGGVDRSVQFSSPDLAIIQEAIEVTICAYDPVDQAIYQPALYNRSDLSLVSKILALADIGSLGIDGIDAYNREGGLLFLEENSDIISIVSIQTIEELEIDRPEFYESLRQRLLNRANFQVNFAKSRFNRFDREIASFSAEVITILKSQVFQYLNIEIIQQLESTTPIDSDRSLASLINFFDLKNLLN